MRFRSYRALKARVSLSVTLCLLASASPMTAQTICPPKMMASYYDPGLHMWFGGTSTISSILADGTVVYTFRGVNLTNELRLVAQHRVAPSQCPDAAIYAMMSVPAIIFRLYTEGFVPRYESIPPGSTCESTGNTGGKVGEGEDRTRIVQPRFDCLVPVSSGGDPGGGGGGGAYITVTTCYYTAYYDSSGNYMYTMLEYCREFYYLMS